MKLSIIIAAMKVLIVVIIYLEVFIYIPRACEGEEIPIPHYNYTAFTRGWHLWSPYESFSGEYKASNLTLQNPDLLVIVFLDSEHKKYQEYVAGDSDIYDFNIVPGRGYWIYWNAEYSSMKWGPTIQLNVSYAASEGWNMVGQCGPYRTSLYEDVQVRAEEFMQRFAIGCEPLVMVELTYDGIWLEHVIGEGTNNFWITPCEAYYIWLGKSGNITYPLFEEIAWSDSPAGTS